MARESIFIGYRRDDTADVAGRIYDALEARFGRERVFKDVDNIPVGANFGDYIKRILPQCRVALILIGPHWIGAKDAAGNHRLQDPNDWVRIEVETALATPGLQVVPVLVNGAQMPRAEDLPASLQPILQLNAAVIRRDPDFRDDIERLGTALRASVRTGLLDLASFGDGRNSPKKSKPASRARSVVWPTIAILVAAGAIVLSIVFGRTLLAQLPSTPTDMRASPAAVEVAQGPPLLPDARSTPATSPAPVLVDPSQLRDFALFRDCPDCPDIVRIPGESFAVGRFEVTFAQWDACVAAGGCNGYTPSDNRWGRGERPVINVSWDDAQLYLQWLSQRTGQRYRLLTSAEWETAARAGTTTNFWWGDQDPVCDESARNGANFGACADDRTRPVGSFQPNGFGLYDVHGNVWEWVEDCYDRICSARVLRGGGWYNTPGNLRSAFRDRLNPTLRDNNVVNWFGFRVVRIV